MNIKLKEGRYVLDFLWFLYHAPHSASQVHRLWLKHLDKMNLIYVYFNFLKFQREVGLFF